jgi:prevent-host-death family protein
MSTLGIRALKQNASQVVAEAAAGVPVTITDRGRPVARIVPITTSRVESLISADRARPALRPLNSLPAPARRRRSQSALTAELEAMRQAERY